MDLEQKIDSLKTAQDRLGRAAERVRGHVGDTVALTQGDLDEFGEASLRVAQISNELVALLRRELKKGSSSPPSGTGGAAS
jgi:hypothetical protein